MDINTRIRTAGIYIPLLTGTLSIIGSSSILYSIWASRSTKLKDPQHRILGMMSIFDIFYSINAALSFLTFPPWWGLGLPTFGNDATCSLQGFFVQFGVAAASYNMVLSIYYYLSINRGMKREEFAKVWEKVLHAIVIICHLSFAITSVSMGIIVPGPGYCYIWDTPFMFPFCLGWILLVFLVIIVTNTLICLFVRGQEKEMKKYRTRSSVDAEQISDMEKKTFYARSVSTQSMFYVGAFLLSWMPLTTTVMFLTISTRVFGVWMGVPVAIFNPLQGFFNAFVYARPRYLRLKNKNKHMGFKQFIKLVFVPSYDDSTCPSAFVGKPEKDSNVFRSFSKETTGKEKTTSSDKKSIQDAEEGKVEEGKKTNGDVSPAEDEDDKVEVEEGAHQTCLCTKSKCNETMQQQD